MPKFNKSKIIAAVAITLGVTAAGVGAGVAVTHAQTTANGTGRWSAFVNAIAQKFNMNPSDVQQVVDQTAQQQQSQMQAKRIQNIKNRITQAVTNGTLTQAQADAINAKIPEVQSFIQSLRGKSAADRKAAIQN